MVELGILAGAAVGIAGDFLAGVVQNLAAGAVTDLVRQRLRSTDDGTGALQGLEVAPQDSGRRMDAAGALVGAAQGDPSFAQALSDAVNSYHREVHQGTATSGSPHHQVNISGAGISGKRHQVAGGNIDNSKKHNTRIGFGALAVLAIVLGGYGVAQWVSSDGGSERSDQSSVAGGTGGLLGSGIGEQQAPTPETLAYDLKEQVGNAEHPYRRARGSLVATPGAAMPSHSTCQLNPPPGTSIVPVKVQLTNTNSPQWTNDAGAEFIRVSVVVTAKAPDGIVPWIHVPEESPEAEGLQQGACQDEFALPSRDEMGASRTVDLLLLGVPKGKETEIVLDVSASYIDKQHGLLKFTVRG